MPHNASHDIYVRDHYEDDYNLFIWEFVVALHKRAESAGKKLGTQRFYKEHLRPTIERHIKRIRISNKPGYKFNFPSEDDIDFKYIQRYLTAPPTIRPDGEGIRKLQMFDAYVQLSDPLAITFYESRQSTHAIGDVIGSFLRDQVFENIDYNLELAKQRIMHFYEYDNIDTLGSRDNTKRYLCLIRGERPSYLLSLDFAFEGEIKVRRTTSKRMRLYYGFCIPGEDFSPLVMKSFGWGERLTGVLYAPASLINLSSPALNQLTFDVFTTDKSFFGDAKSLANGSDALAKALSVHKGLRLQRRLWRISDDLLVSKLKQLVNCFQIDYL